MIKINQRFEYFIFCENDWYLVVSNHASAADIPIVQKIFNRKIPFLKFFLKLLTSNLTTKNAIELFLRIKTMIEE